MQNGVSSAQLTREMCKDYKVTTKLLRKVDKTSKEYESKWSICALIQFNTYIVLCLKDGELSIKVMEFGSLKYMGQVRLIPVY